MLLLMNCMAEDIFEGYKMEELAVYQYLDRIIGKPICAIGRVSNMLCLGIGENIKVVNQKGREVEKSTYALHIQSQWRIINSAKKEILLASLDMYSPRTDMDFHNDFDWDSKGNNLFDEKSQIWLKEKMPIYIKKYKVDQWGDLVLFFSNGERLQTFNSASADSECWRLFMPKSDELHLVVNGLKIEFE